MNSSGDQQTRRNQLFKDAASLPDPNGPNLQTGDDGFAVAEGLWFKLSGVLGARFWQASGGGGGGTIISSRRNHAVNGASVEDYGAGFPLGPIMRTNTQPNAVGGFNGGGTGNKSILGHWLDAPLLLSAFASMQLDYERLTPEITGANIVPYLNAIVELDPVNFPGVLSVLSFGDPADVVLNTGTFSTIGVNLYRTVWTPGANGIQVVSDKGMGPPSPAPPSPLAGPPTVPIFQGIAPPSLWTNHNYHLADILTAYPAARIVNGASGDGGLPKNTPTAGVLVNLGDSGNLAQNAIRINAWTLNGVSL